MDISIFVDTQNEEKVIKYKMTFNYYNKIINILNIIKITKGLGLSTLRNVNNKDISVLYEEFYSDVKQLRNNNDNNTNDTDTNNTNNITSNQNNELKFADKVPS